MSARAIFIQLCGLPNIVFVWIGSAVTGVLVGPRYWAESEKELHYQTCRQCFGFDMRYLDAIACTMPLTLVSFMGVPRPMWFYELGFTAFSTAASSRVGFHGWNIWDTGVGWPLVTSGGSLV
jgi:hypothetical protein